MHKTISIILLMFFIAFQGCITTAVLLTTAVVAHSQSSNNESAVTQIDAKFDGTPDEIYEAAVRVMKKDRKIKVTKEEPGKRMAEAVMGNDKLFVSVRPVFGRTELKVTASSPDVFKGSEHPALDLEKSILKELGVKYEVTEE